MDKYILATKHTQLATFTNYKQQEMFSLKFIVPEFSADSYRGWKIKKAGKIAKELRKVAKAIEKLGEKS